MNAIAAYKDELDKLLENSSDDKAVSGITNARDRETSLTDNHPLRVYAGRSGACDGRRQ